MRLGSYRPPYDVDFSAKERVTLLSGHPNGDTQLLDLGTVSFTHVKAARNKCLNPKIKITFLLKYGVCQGGINHWANRANARGLALEYHKLLYWFSCFQAVNTRQNCRAF